MSVTTSRNPMNAADVVVEHADTAPEDLAELAQAARAAQADWARSPAARGDALLALAGAIEANADELATLITREVGKPIAESKGEVARSAAILRYHAQAGLLPIGDNVPPVDGQGLLLTRRRPRGLAGLITPFNFPLAIPLWKAAPALALGNCVLLKPSPHAIGVALRLSELSAEVLPAGVLSLCVGGAATAQALLDHVDVISFTGSTAVGRHIATFAAGRHLPVQTENGGHNNVVVLPDADPARVASMVARDVAGYSGQKCTAARRVLVCGDAKALTEAVLEALRRLPVGDPSDPATVAGPLITTDAATAVAETIAASVSGGGTVTPALAVGEPGFVAPTVISGAVESLLATREEVFGPVVVVQEVGNVDDAIRCANGSTGQLVSAVHTRDLDAALQISAALDAGMVRVNAPTTGVDLHAPFGGHGDSGFGPREQGRAADALFTREQTITVRSAT